MNTMASWAQQLAWELLQEPLPRRWAHVQGVADTSRASPTGHAALRPFSARTPT